MPQPTFWSGVIGSPDGDAARMAAVTSSRKRSIPQPGFLVASLSGIPVLLGWMLGTTDLGYFH
jgi:hypothetical protein